MQTRDEISSTMDVEQRVRKLETLVTLLVEYINRYNTNNAVNANHLQLLSLSRDEASSNNMTVLGQKPEVLSVSQRQRIFN